VVVLLYKRLKSTKKQNFTTSSFIASLCIMVWPWECGLGLDSAWPWPWPWTAGLGLGLEWSGLVNITGWHTPQHHMTSRSVVFLCAD